MNCHDRMETKLITIESMIKKGELKQRFIYNIPQDLKRLFIEEVVTNLSKKKLTKNIIGYHQKIYDVFQKRKDKNYNNHITKDIQFIPINQNVQHFSLHTAKSQKTYRRIPPKLESQKKKVLQLKHRYSDGQIQKVDKTKQFNCIQNQNNKKNQINKMQLQQIPKKSEENKQIKKFICYNQQILENENLYKSTDDNNDTLDKVIVPQPQTEQNQIKLQKFATQKTTNIEQQKQNKTSTRFRNKTMSSTTDQQNKKLLLLKTYNMQASEILKQVDVQPKRNRSASTKQSSNLSQIKKKININKIPKSSHLFSDLFKPKILFSKMILREKQDQHGNRKYCQTAKYGKNKIKDKIPNFHAKICKYQTEEEVKGWEIKDNPQFFDYY